MKSKETPTNGRKNQSQNKLGSQIGNAVGRAIIKYNDRNDKQTYEKLEHIW